MGYITIEEASNTMGLSTKTTKAELDDLKEDLEVLKCEVKISKTKNQYKLEKEYTCNMDAVYLSIKKKSSYFFLMRTAAFADGNSIKNESSYSYSASKKHKNKKNFIQYLMKYNLELEPRSLEIIGDEMDIRFLFFQFFWNNYRGVEWPFDTVNHQDLIQSIEKCEDELVRNMIEVEKECLVYWLAVITIRLRNNNFIIESQAELVGVTFEGSSIFGEILSKIIDVDGKEKKILSVEAKYLYYYFILTIESSMGSQQLIIDLEKNKNLGIHHMIMKLMVEFKETFRLDESVNYQDLYIPLYKLFLLEIHFQGQLREEEWINIPDTFLSILYENEFQLFYQKMMTKHKRELGNNNYLCERSSVLFSFFIDQKIYRPRIKMKLFSSGGKILELFLEKKLKTISSNVELENRNTKNVDIIISDCLVTTTKEQVFYWSVEPTEKEWNGLLDRLLKIEQSKASIGCNECS